MSSEVHVTGLSDLQKLLDTLPVKVEKNIMRGALRAGMKVVLPVAAQNIHSVSGELAAGLKIGTRIKGQTVTASLTAKGPHGYVAKWVEFGTKPHTISAKGGALSFGGIFAKSVEHPGATPHPFMRPALDQTASAAVIAAANYMEKRIASGGIDTGDILIEGDEP